MKNRKTRILFVDPPTNLIQTPYFPWIILPNPGMVAVAAFMEKAGYDVRYLDANTFGMMEMDPYSKLREMIKEIDPDIVGLSAMTCTLYGNMYIAHMVKTINPNIVTVIGGIHVTFEPELTLRTCEDIDYAVFGEGENTMLELVRTLETHEGPPESLVEKLKTIKGLSFLYRGQFVKNARRPLIEDLDTLPMGCYHLLPMDKYSYPGMYREDWSRPKGISMAASRGCLMHCTFCANNTAWDCTWRGYSGKRVVDELELLYEKYGKSLPFMTDQNFLMDRKRNEEFIAEMKKRKLPLKIWCETSVKSVLENRDLLQDLHDVGLECMLLGIEFSRQEKLDQFRKGITCQDAIECARLFEKHDIVIHPSVMVGDEDETEETIQDLINYISNDIKGRLVTVEILTPLPGSVFYNQSIAEGKIEEFDFEKYDTFYGVISPKNATRGQVQTWRDKVEILTAVTKYRIGKLFQDYRDRCIFKFEMGMFYKKGVLKLRQILYGKLGYHKYKERLLKKQYEVMSRDPRWTKCLEKHGEAWLKENRLEGVPAASPVVARQSI